MELKILRSVAGLTQKQLADLAGIDDSTISAIETGRRDIRSMTYESVVRISQVLGVHPDKLWPVEPVAGPAAETEKSA